MSLRKISKVAGLIGSSLLNLNILAIVILVVIALSSKPSGEGQFSLILYVYDIVPRYIIPGLLILALSVFCSEKLDAGYVWTAVVHLLAGVWYTFIGVNSLTSIRDYHISLELALVVITGLGGLHLLISGFLRMVTLFTESKRAPRNGGYPQYYR